MRLALLNLRYSPNLGDVLLCECLEYGLRQVMPDIGIVALDITGRREFATGSKRRLAAMAVLQRLPQPVRQQIARLVLGRSLRRTLPYWTEQLAGVDAAVLGGGNLLADADLNFPLKVAAIMRAVAAAGLPAAVHAMGVSDNWSRPGEALFREALAGVQLRHATVRDERSRATWVRRLGPAGIAPPEIANDPGLLTADCFPAQPRPTGAALRVGLCVTHPVALSYHADEAMPAAAALNAWLAELVGAITRQGRAVLLFTTGSSEDEAYLDEEMPRLAAATDQAGSLSRMPRFAGAGAMAGFISTLDLLIAHRLHACVAAYAYRIPHVGLTWDSKMQSFFDLVDRPNYLRAAVTASVAEIIVLAEDALTSGIDPDHHRTVIAKTQADIARLVDALR